MAQLALGKEWRGKCSVYVKGGSVVDVMVSYPSNLINSDKPWLLLNLYDQLPLFSDTCLEHRPTVVMSYPSHLITPPPPLGR